LVSTTSYEFILVAVLRSAQLCI